MLHALLWVHFSLVCKVDKASIIFFWNWMLHIGSLSTKFTKNSKEKSSQLIFERMLYASHTSASIFSSRYILNFFGKSIITDSIRDLQSSDLFFVNWFKIPSDKNTHVLVPSLLVMDVTCKISASIFASTTFLSLNFRALAWDTLGL